MKDFFGKISPKDMYKFHAAQKKWQNKHATSHYIAKYE